MVSKLKQEIDFLRQAPIFVQAVDYSLINGFVVVEKPSLTSIK